MKNRVPRSEAIKVSLEVLGLSVGASPDDVKTAYRKAALKHHPDKGGNARDFQNVKRARDVLIEHGTGCTGFFRASKIAGIKVQGNSVIISIRVS